MADFEILRDWTYFDADTGSLARRKELQRTVQTVRAFEQEKHRARIYLARRFEFPAAQTNAIFLYPRTALPSRVMSLRFHRAGSVTP